MIVAASTRPNRQNRSTCSCISVPWFEVARADYMAESIEMCELLNTESHYCFDVNNKGPLYFPLDGELRRGGKAALRSAR